MSVTISCPSTQFEELYESLVNLGTHLPPKDNSPFYLLSLHFELNTLKYPFLFMIFIDTYIRVVDEISNLLFYPLISFIYNLSSLDYIINILIYYIFYRLLNETPISILRFFKFLYLEILVNLSEVFLTLVPRVRR